VGKQVLDIWDETTYGEKISTLLNESIENIIKYHERKKEIDNFPENSSKYEFSRYLMEINEYGDAFNKIEEELSCILEDNFIRGFHYTKLVDSEIIEMKNDGIFLSNRSKLRERLDFLHESGTISRELLEKIMADSPFNKPDHNLFRSNKFYLTSEPLPVSFAGIEKFLRYWGGESCFFHLQNCPEILQKLEGIGEPCILEIAIPMNKKNKSISSMVAIRIIHHILLIRNYPITVTYPEICCKMPLPPSSIQKIHTRDSELFSKMGNTYPEKYASIKHKYNLSP